MKYLRLLKPILITLAITLKCTLLSAQSKDSIIGIWRVEEVAMTSKITPNEQQPFNRIKKAFRKSTFTFKANHQAVVTSDEPELRIDNGYWEYTADKKLITITEWKDRMVKQKGVLMAIFVKDESDGKTYFYLDETPIKLSVKR
ncbi:hypothetical protein [Chitinophaga sancti]|uniref:hypothetical protein n=1 Tax=Chitinophaga sancti TaxID=1004 RepID=UPI003F7A3F27